MRMGDQEQRRLPRHTIRAVAFIDGGECDDKIAYLRDVNRRGAFLYTNSSITAGTELQLLLLVGPQDVAVPVACTGQAIRVESAPAANYARGVAVQFRTVEILDNILPCS